MPWKKKENTSVPHRSWNDELSLAISWRSLSLLTTNILSVLLLISSNYFDAKLPSKVSIEPFEEYSHPSSILKKIYAATENDTVKVIEPVLSIDHTRAVLDIIIFEYYNESSNTEQDLASYTTGIILLEELDHPFQNYFGLTNDYYYQLNNFFEETIATVYFDEVTDAMNLDDLIHWLQANNILRFILFVWLVLITAVQILIGLVSEDRFKLLKKGTLFTINAFICLSILGNVSCFCLINNRYPSALNGFNLTTSIITMVSAVLSNTLILL